MVELTEQEILTAYLAWEEDLAFDWSSATSEEQVNWLRRSREARHILHDFLEAKGLLTFDSVVGAPVPAPDN